MRNIAVIGCGNLGRRHLESLMKTKEALNLYAIDCSPSSLNLVAEVNSMHNPKNKHKLNIGENTTILPEELDFVVIASNSTDRRKLIENLLLRNNVKYLLLEKVLFQKIEDYNAIDSLLAKSQTKAWVNCNMQTMSQYISIKKILGNGCGFNFSVSGGQWGLGCNAIHYLSLIAFLGGTSDDFFINGSRLDDGHIMSKREGFIEFNGILFGNTPKCNSFTISCSADWYSPGIVTIQNENISASILESGHIQISTREKNWEVEESKFRFPYQSELTGALFEELINTGNCGLPEYQESSKLHRKLLTVFLTHLNKFSSKETDVCMIT
jgi:predicted dehydrogenase